MRLLLTLSLAVIPALSFSQDLAENKSGTLSGVVFDGSAQDEAVLTGQEVVLHQYVNGKEVEGARAHAVTDSKGRFIFSGLDSGLGLAYYPGAVFEGTPYYGGLIRFAPDSLEKRSDVVVFRSSTSDSGIAVVRHHIIVTPESGELQVKELFVFSNDSRFTFVGSPAMRRDSKNLVLTMAVPDHADKMSFGGELMGCCAVVDGNRVYDTMVFKPGVRQVAISYVLPYEDSETTINKIVSYPTMETDVFIPEGPISLSVAGFSSRGSFALYGKQYHRYAMANLGAGDFMNLTLSGLPGAPADWRWAPLALLFIVAFGGPILYRKRLKARHIEGAESATEHQQLTEPDDVSTCESIDEPILSTETERTGKTIQPADEVGQTTSHEGERR